jgi:hypothetical protein
MFPDFRSRDLRVTIRALRPRGYAYVRETCRLRLLIQYVDSILKGKRRFSCSHAFLYRLVQLEQTLFLSGDSPEKNTTVCLLLTCTKDQTRISVKDISLVKRHLIFVSHWITYYQYLDLLIKKVKSMVGPLRNTALLEAELKDDSFRLHYFLYFSIKLVNSFV